MMKKFIVFGLLISFTAISDISVAKELKDFKPNNLQLSGGWAFPMSSFSRPTVPTLHELNGADRGIAANVVYTRYVAKWIGFGLIFDYANYKTDTIGLRDIIGDPTSTLRELSADRWHNFSAKASLNLRLPLFWGLSIVGRGTIGYAWQVSPEIVINTKTDNNYISSTLLKNKAGNLTYGAGAGILWKILGPLTLSANFDYNWALPFKYSENSIKKVVNGAESQINKLEDFKQRYQGISFVLGLGFTF